jgi:hypothetical protein
MPRRLARSGLQQKPPGWQRLPHLGIHMADWKAITALWCKKIDLAWQLKKSEFGDDAAEAMMFYNGPYDEMYGPKNVRGGTDDDDLPAPSFRATINKVAEMVQLFGPALYHQNPTRKVTPRELPEMPPDVVQLILQIYADPMAQMELQQGLMQESSEKAADKARAIMLELYLNYTQVALGLKTESRKAIDEAIIKGMGLLWPEVYTPPGAGMKMVGSFYDTVDNLVIDPDAEDLSEAKWIARRCCHPYWEVEREYGLAPDALKGKANLESQNGQATSAAVSDYRKKHGKTNDLIVYWKVYSKMGAGGLLAGIAPQYAQGLEVFGDFVFLVVADNCDFPLNLPPEFHAALEPEEPTTIDEGSGEAVMPMPVDPAMQQQAVERLNWPTPYWADGGWPFVPISFRWVPKRVWPMSHLKPAMGELKFLQWAYSCLMSKIRVASRDFIAIAKSAGEDIRQRIKHGADYTIVEVEQIHGAITAVVQFLQHPGFNPEIYTVIQGVMEMFERRTGLSELMYGISSRQYRSAEEAQMKGDFTSIRPDDMARCVEDAMTDLARKEALCVRWHLTGQDVEPRLGPLGARWWDLWVTPADPSRILHQLEYTIEADSARKPNKGLERDNMAAAQQTYQPLLWQYAVQTGNVTPFNALTKAWAKSINLDPTEFLFPEGSMPLPVPPEPPGGAPQQGGVPA